MQIETLNIDKPWQDHIFKKPAKKAVCVVRYGGFGDLLQTSSIFPALKKEGYHITVNTSPTGFDIIKEDPHIDAVFLQEMEQVPNKELGLYWGEMEKHFDKFVQLSESIEGSLLALPGRPEYTLSKRVRHKRMNRNYFAQMHHIASVPLPPKPKFFPSFSETVAVKEYLEQLGAGPKIIWSLSGSSVHKAWPYTDQVIARILLDYKDAKIIFVGDQMCQLLEEQWRHENRIKRESGRMSIRNTLALSQKVDLVVGPETGVLNCVAYEKVEKILMLSHSSKVNLGGSWVNTKVMEPKRTPCYPCHKLHYGWKTCVRDEVTGGALCAANISPDKVYKAVRRALR